MSVLKGKKLKEYLDNQYYKSGVYRPKEHRTHNVIPLGGTSYKKDNTNSAENYYNGHWDENYIDRYMNDNE